MHNKNQRKQHALLRLHMAESQEPSASRLSSHFLPRKKSNDVAFKTESQAVPQRKNVSVSRRK